MAEKNYVPLTSGFMLTSIVGFLVSVFYVIKISLNWGFAFAVFFAVMFIASVVSMSNLADDSRAGWDELAIHERKGRKK